MTLIPLNFDTILNVHDWMLNPRVVLNTRYGGFGLSSEAVNWLAERGHPLAQSYVKDMIDPLSTRPTPYRDMTLNGIDRSDPLLVACIEALGTKQASGEFSSLEVVPLPVGKLTWGITDDAGKESLNDGNEYSPTWLTSFVARMAQQTLFHWP